MKKLLSIMLAMILVFSMVACSNKSEASSEEGEKEVVKESVTITTLNGDKEEVEIEVPYNPERVAVMDLAVLDILDNLGLGDKVVGVSKGSSIDYLEKYVNDENLINLGTIKEMSIEKVMESAPDVIFIGGRLSSQYDALSEIAPVVFLATDVNNGVVESTKDNATTVATIFGAENQIEELFSDYDARIEALREVAEGKTAFVGMLNAGGFNVLGNDGRCSIIGVEVGFENIGLNAKSDEDNTITSAHGNETSFEYILRLNPDYIFVMNRDAAIGTEGAAPAEEVIENDLVKKTDAYLNGNIVYLEHSNVWYTAEGGITAMDYMLKDLENTLVK